MARMGRQNFIDRWVDNKSYQYSLSIFILVDPGKVNFGEFAIRPCRAANLAVPEEDINVEEMTNTIFAGAEAACCSMQVDQTPLNGLMERLRDSKDILRVMLSTSN